MDPNDLIKAAPEIAKGLTAVGAAIPFTAIVKRMLGPAADELAEMWRDQVRLYRYERQLKCVEKAERMAQAAGFEPQAVPPKILFPLLEGASMEEDESLHNMWAALLANASSNRTIVVRPRFIALLREMTADEAQLLSVLPIEQERIEELDGPLLDEPGALEHYADQLLVVRDRIKNNFPAFPGESEGNKESRFATCLAALRDSGLIYDSITGSNSDCRLTPTGSQFLLACYPPKSKT